jgi:hypothetical protein
MVHTQARAAKIHLLSFKYIPLRFLGKGISKVSLILSIETPFFIRYIGYRLIFHSISEKQIPIALPSTDSYLSFPS